jgi:2-oxoglutarate ferredoxin oxidoreductase subunit gamma
MRREIRIAGFGGQGVVLTGYILGKALALYDGYEAVMTQAYGPEARGGSSSANLVVADEPIDYPFVQHPDVLVALSQEAFTRFRVSLKESGLVVTDADLVVPEPGDIVHSVPATGIAEELGRRIVANVVILGFYTALSDLIGREAVEQALRSSVKAKVVDLNLEAFARGYAWAEEKEVKV